MSSQVTNRPLTRQFACLGILLVVAFVDYYIPPSVQAVWFYLLPLVWLSLRASLSATLLTCVAAALLWATSNWLNTGGYLLTAERIWNTISRLILFCFVSSLIHFFIQQLREKERAMKLLRDSKMANNPAMGLRRCCSCCDRVQTNHGDWVPLKVWLARDCMTTWADSVCPGCAGQESHGRKA